MKGGGVEAVRAALWRSRWLLLACVITGIVAVNLVAQSGGARYAATTKLLISEQDLGATLTGAQLPYVDPERAQSTALSLARSPELFQRVAIADPSLGTSSEIESAMTVEGSRTNNILDFTATTDDPARSTRMANGVAEEYARWRAEVLAAPVRAAIEQVQRRLEEGTGNEATLRPRLETLRILDTLSSGNATVVDRAISADQTRPAPVRDSLVGLALGLIVGLLAIGVREALDTTVRNESDAEELLGLPVLAAIPSFGRNSSRLVVLGRTREAFEDSYALLAADLEYRRQDAGPTVIAVTSASSGEGKSATAANLAVVLARRGGRTFLVDMDLRRPIQHEIFRIPAQSTGVAELLTGEGQGVRGVASVVRVDQAEPAARPLYARSLGADMAADAQGGPSVAEEGASELSVITAGGSTRVPPASLVRAPQMRPFLDELRRQADWIVIDTPPALRTVEAAQLSRVVDAFLIVVRQGRASRRGLRALERQIKSWAAAPLGIVLTHASAGRETYGYYGRR